MAMFMKLKFFRNATKEEKNGRTVFTTDSISWYKFAIERYTINENNHRDFYLYYDHPEDGHIPILFVEDGTPQDFFDAAQGLSGKEWKAAMYIVSNYFEKR